VKDALAIARSGGIVPAIVVFSVALGVALIGIENKATLLDVLETITTALDRITGTIVRLAPIGVFALMASAAGTLELADLGRIQVYLLSYVGVALVLVLWVLPALVRMVELVSPAVAGSHRSKGERRTQLAPVDAGTEQPITRTCNAGRHESELVYPLDASRFTGVQCPARLYTLCAQLTHVKDSGRALLAKEALQ